MPPRFLLDPGKPFASPQLGIDVRRRDLRGLPYHQQVVEQIGRFRDHRLRVTLDGGDYVLELGRLDGVAASLASPMLQTFFSR